MRQNQNKTKLPKYHWVLCVCVGRLLLAVEPALKCGMYMQWDSPGEAQFSFLLCEWLSTKAPGLGLGTPVYFSVSALGPPLLWTWTGPMHDAPGSVHTCMYRVHTSVSPVGCGRHCFLGIIHSLWLVQSFCLPQCSLIPEGKASPEGSVLSGFESTETDLPRQTTASHFLLLLQNVNCWVSEGQENHRTKDKAKGVKQKLLVCGGQASKENTALATSGTCPGQAQHQSQSWEVKRLQVQLGLLSMPPTSAALTPVL